ncbi:hypothetical protein BOX15_Mlig022188g2 [Macrostomum lignano]|uniref:Methyltransferase-like protein 17, mitochondrial n=1 Tax=Macrostomum lignano TaxID=282301 RepID=A0A267E2U6_9PLAT|nr:hypothetical protein BOX15_Mlig022188g2 [Macrostomum lignano]
MIPGVTRPLRLRADESIRSVADRFFTRRRRGEQQPPEATLRDFLRRHPAAASLPPIRLPLRLDRAAVFALKSVPESPANLEAQAAVLCSRWMLDAPLKDRYTYKKEVLRRLEQRDAKKLEEMAEAGAPEEEQAMEAARQKAERLQLTPIVKRYAAADSRHTFSNRNCILYMVARLAPNYSAGVRVLYQLRKRWPEFRPRTLFDYGSGVGTSAWAANTVWPGLLREHFMVDPCSSMNSLAGLLMQDGSPRRPACFPGVFLRQFLPASVDRRYDLVTCAHSLLTLQDAGLRADTLDTLWAKVEPGGALVIIEYGNRAGFAAVAEARQHLLDNYGLADADTGRLSPVDGAHIVAPCPHDSPCPRLAKRCSFPNQYVQFRLSSQTPPEVLMDTFAYLIIAKGSPGDLALPAWPRIIETGSSRVRTDSVRRHGKDSHGQALVGLCLPNGSAGCYGFSRGNTDPDLLLVAHAAKIGDRLPALVDSETGESCPEPLPEPDWADDEGESIEDRVEESTGAVSG